MSRRQLTPARAAQVKGYAIVSANGTPIDDTMSVEDTVKLFGVRPNNFINLCRCSTGWSMRGASRDHEKPHGITWAARQFPQAHTVACVAGNDTLPPRCLVLRALVFTTCSKDTAV